MESPKGNGPDLEPEEEGTAAEPEIVEEAQTGLENALKARDAAQKDLLYLKAEFDNYRKRILRDQEQAIKFGNEKVITEILPVVDLLERALNAAKPLQSRAEDKEANNFVTGIEMTYRQLVNVLGKIGVEFIGNAGEKFDPIRHEAISQRESTEDEPGTVLDVLQKGCLLQGRLLKPAQVVVATKSE